MIYYAAGALVHKAVVDLSRMVRVRLTSLTPKKQVAEGGKSSRMTIGKDEALITINHNAGKKQVAARLCSYRDSTGDNETQLTEQTLLSAIKNYKVNTIVLRCMTNTKTAKKKQDWFKYIKHVEFAMRSSSISGTHITPFEAARGRLPRLVIDNPFRDRLRPGFIPKDPV